MSRIGSSRPQTMIGWALWGLGATVSALSHAASPGAISGQGNSTEVSVASLYSVPKPTSVALSPDGAHILVTIERPTTDGLLRGVSSLSIVEVATGNVRPVSTTNRQGQQRSGEAWPTFPRAKWGHDGSYLLWLDSDGSTDQLWRYSVATGEVHKITTGKGRVYDFAESPDGSVIALVRSAQPRRRAAALVDAEAYHFSDHPEGWWDPAMTDLVNIELLDTRSGEYEDIAQNLTFAIELSWDAASERLLFVPRIDSWGGMIVAPMIYNRTTRRLTEAVRPDSTLRLPTWSPDGRTLVWVEHLLHSRASREPREGIQYTGGLFSQLRVLMTGELQDDQVRLKHTLLDPHAGLAMGRMHLNWTQENHILVPLVSQARRRIYAIDAATGARKLITPSEFHVAAYDVSKDRTRWTAILTNADTPPEVFIGDLAGGTPRQVTRIAPDLPFNPASVRPVQWRSGDDRFDVHGWLVLPPHYDPSRRYPMVVDIHGGPAATVWDSFWDIQLGTLTPAILASRGYVVLLPNPRGDSGYSAAFESALVGDFMTGDVEMDILPGVEAMVAAGIANPGQLAVTGFSAGATRVAWAIAHTHRFKAASFSDGLVNFLSYWGQALPANTGWIEFYLEGDPTQQMEEYLRRSPITHAWKIETPLLMRFANKSAKLWDSPATLQGKELQAMLYMKGVPTEIQIEPLAGHPPRTIDSMQLWVDTNLAWFDHWLLGRPYVRRRPCEDAAKVDGESVEPCVLKAPEGGVR